MVKKGSGGGGAGTGTNGGGIYIYFSSVAPYNKVCSGVFKNNLYSFYFNDVYIAKNFNLKYTS